MSVKAAPCHKPNVIFVTAVTELDPASTRGVMVWVYNQQHPAVLLAEHAGSGTTGVAS